MLPSGTVQNEGVPGLRRILRERAHDQPHPTDAVHERVVDLAVHREAVAFQTLDQVDLPERPVEVQLVAVQPRDEDAELALSAGVWQRRVPNVVIQVHVVDLLHDGQPRADQRRLQELQVPGRRHRLRRAHPREQVLQVAGRSVRRLGELEQAADVHRRVARLDRKPGGIDRRDAAHLYSILPSTPRSLAGSVTAARRGREPASLPSATQVSSRSWWARRAGPTLKRRIARTGEARSRAQGQDAAAREAPCGAAQAESLLRR